MSALELVQRGKLVSVTASAPVLLSSVQYLYKLAHCPVVIHLALLHGSAADYSEITAVRQTGLIFLQSESLVEAQDMSMTAHALATRTMKGVVHFFCPNYSVHDKPGAVEDHDLLRQLLDFGALQTFRARRTEEGSLYVDDPRPITTLTGSILPPNKKIDLSLFPSPPSGNAAAGSQTTTREGSSHGTSRRDSSVGSGPVTSPATSVDLAPERPLSSAAIRDVACEIWSRVALLTGRQYRPFEYSGPSSAKSILFIFGADAGEFGQVIDASLSADGYANIGILTPRLFRPWLPADFLAELPKSAERIAVLERMRRGSAKWGPMLLDVLATVKGGQSNLGGFSVVGYQLGDLSSPAIPQAIKGIIQNLESEAPVQNLTVGYQSGSRPSDIAVEEVKHPRLESAYTKILEQLFGERLYVGNAQEPNVRGLSPATAAKPLFGLGSLLERKERRKRLVEEARAAAKARDFATGTPLDWLSKWAISADDTTKANKLAPQLISRLATDGSRRASELLEKKGLFKKESQWLIGSDAWAYDLGNSGVHHVLASGTDINMLIIDSEPYSERVAADAHRRKKDIGLYAMNFGNAYVASVAIYSSYTQVLQAFAEADEFKGPSIVLAYLPYHTENDSALTALQETKKAVDLGYWPLYRWHPAPEGDDEPRFSLDSERIKGELQEFLRRDQQLTQLARKNPRFAASLSESYGSEVRTLQKRNARDAYNKLLEGLYGAPLTILYASDNGNAEGLAKRLGARSRARSLKATVLAMDEYPMEDLTTEENLVLMTSTAGQGEFPQNGRAFWETVKNATDIDITGVSYAVFGLGDSHYWPRKDDKIYYNKPGIDLDARMTVLGGKRLTEVGLGDDQDPDGYQTGYAEWEPKLWKALGVDKVEGVAEEPPPITNEDIKIQSNYLRGTIAEGLEDQSTGAISAHDQQLTKFHGTYMQDDRDLRDERKAQGLEPAYAFMIRCRLPGGVATPTQWLQMDSICSLYGNETMKLTTRQTFQFHGVIKGKLRPAMQAINAALMTTLAACGDVNRNVMCSSLPEHSRLHREVHAISKRISDHLLPSTTAYHEIWLRDDDNKKVQVAGNAVVDSEPLYGPTYLPRKFKITIAVPPHNDTDVYAHDVGLIAIKNENGGLAGFNVLVGGGMGVTHGNKKTYPRTGSMFGYLPADIVHLACEKIMLVQRDHGDRTNRKHARLKYTIDDMGVDVYKQKVEALLGTTFAEPRPFTFDSNIDTFGWQRDEEGLNHFTFFIENGRVEDTPTFRMRTGLREIAKAHTGEFRLTGNQHLTLSRVRDGDAPAMRELLARYGLDNVRFSGLRLSSSACVAFPTCGLAMAESERYLPQLIGKLETTLEQAGLRHDSIVMRMTGCPNGCARPWLAEVALVGKAYGAYNLYLGGGYHGQRLNKLYRSSVGEAEILAALTPLLKRYALERRDADERFGDFCIRAGIIKPTTEGRKFHDDVRLFFSLFLFFFLSFLLLFLFRLFLYFSPLPSRPSSYLFSLAFLHFLPPLPLLPSLPLPTLPLPVPPFRLISTHFRKRDTHTIVNLKLKKNKPNIGGGRRGTRRVNIYNIIYPYGRRMYTVCPRTTLSFSFFFFPF